jgi:hypothetical protein
LKVAQQVSVEGLGGVIGVKTQQLERQDALHLALGWHHSGPTFVLYRSVGCPSATDAVIGHAQHKTILRAWCRSVVQ